MVPSPPHHLVARVTLYLIMVLPWYIAVQKRNPNFYKFFLLEQNLERFATNRYQHHQPFFFYVVVLLIGLMPWTVIAIRALVDSIEVSIAEWKVRHNPSRYLGHTRAGDAFLSSSSSGHSSPIVFFSFSGSKLPGYILPSIPPLTIPHRRLPQPHPPRGPPKMAALVSRRALCRHGLCSCPRPTAHEVRDARPLSAMAVPRCRCSALLRAVVFLIVRRWSISQICNATLIPVLAALIFVLGFYGKELDINYSARPLARAIQREAPDVKLVATDSIKRDMDYGLAFYRNQPMIHYETDGVPDAEHILVVRANDNTGLDRWLTGRIYTPLFLYESQGLEVYRVYAKP